MEETKKNKGGRPKASHTLATEQMRKKLVKYVNKEFVPIVKSMIESAKGLYYEQITKEGKRTVYKEKPDTKAGTYLLDQTAGKAKESLEVQGKVTLVMDD